MSLFHDQMSNIDIKKSMEVIISGQLLTSMIDETIPLESSCNGILIGKSTGKKPLIEFPEYTNTLIKSQIF